ncbi:nucleoside triphosphate hydrolase [Arenicella chitinivorans]|uniref:PhoH-like protein n=1 Tax=Arenicella chitinivorans TaxID=1329800 RepID=A0A918VM09_9GAMM|nr:PhoH family protein [Arenicella chitinivorans]GHA12164.1 nucleoside triphosphate hydrolase [Arenicella chitinivorans]
MNQALPAKTLSLGSHESPVDNARLSILCGECHRNIKIIEDELLVKCYQQGSDFVLQGKLSHLDIAQRVIKKLYHLTAGMAGSTGLEESKVYQVINNMSEPAEQDMEFERVMAPLKPVVAKSKTQSEYLRAIDKYDVVFGIGPAGTGKTYLAVAKAVEALVNEDVKRIVLVRPVVEAGENLGFLPGDIGQKIDPYLRPLYDALYELLGVERVARMIDQKIIELAPLAYMRGRTLSDAFVIMDEAQNTTISQMKMLLTRTGFGSKVVLTGDLSQVDLPKGTYSGLKHALTVLRDVKGMYVNKFTGKDIVRHPLVQRIVDAYEKHERND